MKIDKKIVISFMLLTQLSTLYAEDDIKSKTEDILNTIDSVKIKHWNDDKFYIDFLAKYGQSFWDPGLSSDDPNNSKDIISYETEGLGYYKINLDVGYSGHSIFNYSKLSSITQTQEQEELLAINSSAEGGLDGYTMGFSLEAIVSKLGIDNKLINTLLTYRFEKTDTAFFGVAKAEQDLYYYTKSSSGTLIEKDDIISFKTTFEDQRHTVSSRYFTRDTKTFMRVGAYKSEWTKPTSFGNSNDGKPALELAEYSTLGTTFIVTNYQGIKIPGLNYDFSLDYGIWNSFTSFNSDASTDLEENEDLSYMAVKLDTSYKYIPLATKYQRLAFIIGASIDYKKWSISDGDENTENLDLDAETLYSIYSSIEYRFSY